MRSIVRFYPSVFYGLVLVACMPWCVHAQSTNSNRRQQKCSMNSKREFKRRPVQPLIALDFRRTWIGTPNNEDIPINLRGVRVGVIIHERHRTGLGYSVIHNANLHDHTGAPIHLKYHSFSVFYEYYFLHTRHWSAGVPVELGTGRYKVEGNNPALDGQTNSVTAAGIALDLHYRPIRWLSLNTMGGYRYVFDDGPIDLNNWFFSLGVSVPLGYLLQELQYRHRENKVHKCLKNKDR